VFASQSKSRLKRLVAGFGGAILVIAGTAAGSYAGSNPGMDQNGNPVATTKKPGALITHSPLKGFEFRGTGTLVSNVFGVTCPGQKCTASTGDCGCLTYSGTGRGTKVGFGATWTYNQTTNDDDVVLTGLSDDRCFPTEGDGSITSRDGTDSIVFHASGWGCEFGGLTFFNTENTIYLSPGAGNLANARGTAHLAISTEFESSSTFLNIDGFYQNSVALGSRDPNPAR
jgi:hypothetical protein